MVDFLAQTMQESAQRMDSYRRIASLSLRSFNGGAAGMASSPESAYAAGANIQMHGSGEQAAAQAAEQIRYFRNTVSTAIRPIANSIGKQPLRVGLQLPKTIIAKYRTRFQTKAHKARFERAPMMVKAFSESVELLDAHPIYDLLENPNEYMTQANLKRFLAQSLQLCGVGYLWLTKDGAKWTVWVLPPHWVSPVHKEGKPFDHYDVRPWGASKGFSVPTNEILRVYYEDIGDPLGYSSPLQQTAMDVEIEAKIGRSQLQSYESPRPGVVIKAGRLPGPDGREGRRPILTPAQRRQLISAVKSMYSGVFQNSEPLILDGLIEDFFRFTQTPVELDYQAAEKSKQAKIFQAFGVNPIVCGMVEGANRASAYIAWHSLYEGVVNPLLEMLSQAFTKWLAPWFPVAAGCKLYVWFEECVAFDAQLELQKFQAAITAAPNYGMHVVTLNQAKEYLGLPPVEGGDEDEMPMPLTAQLDVGASEPIDTNQPVDLSGDGQNAAPAGSQAAATVTTKNLRFKGGPGSGRRGNLSNKPEESLLAAESTTTHADDVAAAKAASARAQEAVRDAMPQGYSASAEQHAEAGRRYRVAQQAHNDAAKAWMKAHKSSPESDRAGPGGSSQHSANASMHKYQANQARQMAIFHEKAAKEMRGAKALTNGHGTLHV